MNLDYVTRRVKEIRKISTKLNGDPDAHYAEDKLYEEVLRYFATVADVDVANIAIEALKTQDIDFSRWYE